LSKLFAVAEAAAVAGGRFALKAGQAVERVVIDSRQAGPGTLFVPLPGSRTDGHEHLLDALARGSAAVLVERRRWRRLAAVVGPEARQRGASVILVASPLAALQDLARFHLRRLGEVRRVGVTGSNGKTTTKELIAGMLAREAPTAATAGNLNSEIGLPLASFQVGPQHRYAVFEMGVNRRGEMDVLAGIARPQAVLITNIGTAHIGPLGSQEGIAREKKRAFRGFNGRQKAFLFEGEPYYRYLARGVRGQVIPFGPKSTPGFEGSEDLGLDGTLIRWEGLRIRFPLFGHHNLLNALGALTLAVQMGASREAVRGALEAAAPLEGRSQILRGERGGPTVIQDCYNANPESMRRLLEFVTPLAWPGRKIAVLGSMLELGEATHEEHRRIGAAAARAGFDCLLLFGDEMAGAYEELRRSGFSGYAEWTADFASLRQQLRNLARPEDLVVLKGSRSLELERLVPEIRP
jgi:UDP-N-acetylmuramoyl-tripeptide--D-alanyl-D-alanine ligase